MDNVEIYTDGACSGNPGPGGWAAILISGSHEREIAGYEASTTNNRMELMAVIMALEGLKRQCRVTIFSDSAYIVNCFQQGWLENWKRNGWRRGPRKNEPVANADLWKKLDALVQQQQVTWAKVKGHAGVELNERVDQLATAQIRRHSGI